MTIGFPTIIIPAIQGGDARHTSEDDFTLSKEDISLISEYFYYRNSVKSVGTFLVNHVFMLHSLVDRYGFINTIVRDN